MATPKLSAGLIIALAATGVFLTLVTAGIIATQTVASNGTVSSVNVGVYSNIQCNQNCTSLKWGTLYPGNSTSKTIYVKNTGTIPITLSMTTESWTPTTADDYLTLSWNQQNTVLDPGESTPATITLSADSDTGSLTSFSFNIVIAGAE
jgi:archaellum component FlaF (FlaF/FlaG flagellin family)